MPNKMKEIPLSEVGVATSEGQADVREVEATETGTDNVPMTETGIEDTPHICAPSILTELTEQQLGALSRK